MTTNHLLLNGCAPTPLARYLKAIGILRLVSEQVDSEVLGAWQDENFLLTTILNRAELFRFFLEKYRPTPILAPWNGGSGFYKKGNETAWSTLETFKTSKAERFKPIADTAGFMASLVDELKIQLRPDNNLKPLFLTRLRSESDETGLLWLDAAILLSGDNPQYPPLLGTGGNDGRLDFTSNFLQRLLVLFDKDSGFPTLEAPGFLRLALFDEPVAGLGGGAIGQFAPGSIGGPNSTTGFEGGSLVNPWDFVFMIEGAILFAALATRKHETSQPGAFSYPFTVRPSGSGIGSVSLSDESSIRAEMYLPLWHKLAGLDEIKALLGEGRANLNKQIVRNGLDFVRAIAKLGVDRGIKSFQRYAFVMRSGKAYLATPLNRISVQRNPKADLIDNLDRSGWLSDFKRLSKGNTAPAKLQKLARRLEDSLFDMVRDSSPIRIQRVLRALGAAQQYLGKNETHQENLPPVPGLSNQWVIAADDHSHEFRIAAALAGINEKGMPLGAHLAPIDPAKPWQWKSDSRMVVWTPGNLTANLFSILERRLMEATLHNLDDKPFSGWPPADKAATAAFLNGETND
jgi:CRISPR-associated protein Csx17